jgi:NAD(P)-dependent dehydrogenase (short-subunit alcohol dehydrogenase family)
MRALVTGSGGTGSIGRATVLALVEEGADVVINDVASREVEANDAKAEVEAAGGRAFMVLADVTKVSECGRLVAEASELLGGLDLLVNNAGGPIDKAFLDIDETHYDQQIDLHLKGPFFLAQAAARLMLAQGKGRIINISSEQSYIGEPLLIPYTMAKAGLRTFTKSLALALAPTITVNTVAPGPTATARFREGREYNEETRVTIPLRRFVEPRDVARSVVFLASSDGDAYTGQTLDPNCGVVMD